MASLEAARRFALALPDVTEQPHFDLSSWRVRGKIFATIPPLEDRLHIFLAQPDIQAAVAEDGRAFEELWWGKQMRGLRVLLAHTTDRLVAELLDDAWRQRAPAALIRDFDVRNRVVGGLSLPTQ